MLPQPVKRILIRLSVVTVFLIMPATAFSQVMITPNSITPAGWARFELSVVNGREAQVTAVRVVVPEIVSILGVEANGDWQFRLQPVASDAPQYIEWSNDSLSAGGLATFSFLGRVAGDAKERTLVFPTTILRGEEVQEIDAHQQGMEVQIIGSTILTPWAGLGVSALAFAVSMVAVGLAAWKNTRAQA